MKIANTNGIASMMFRCVVSALIAVTRLAASWVPT